MRTLIVFLLLATSLVRTQPLWQPQNSNIPLTEMVGIFSPVDDRVCWASTVDTNNTAPSGYIKTTDGGNTWAYARIPGTGTGIIGQIEPLDADTAYAAVWVWSPSNSAGVYKTTDGGSTWTKQNVYGPSTSQYGPGVIHFFDALNGVVVGTWHPETYTTTDGGQHWNLASIPPAYGWEYEWSELVSAGNCSWFTTNARVFRCTNRGYTWSASASEPQYSTWFPCISFQDANTGIYSQKLEGQLPHRYRRTTDGGMTWTLLSSPILDSIAPTGIRHIPGTRATYLIAGGMNSGMRGLALTHDAGEHWALIDTIGACFVGFASDSVGWCSPHQHTNAVWKYVGPRLTPIRSIVANLNAGWNMVSVPFTVDDYSKASLFPTAISAAYAFGSSGYEAHDPLASGLGYFLKFNGAQSVTMTGVLRQSDTIDVRTGWNMIGSISAPVATSTISSIPGGIVTSQVVGYDGAYGSTDTIQPGRAYWVKVNQNGQLILSSSSEPASAGRIRMVITTEQPPLPPDAIVSEVRVGRPTEFAVKQNFPNPFNPSTSIKYELPRTTHVSLNVYDMLGREVATLMNEEKSAGVYTVHWDASGIASGVYFYRLKAGDFVQTKRMLLMR
jgi:hypothetical protein